ncbi:MAG: LysR family transcriptional regulator [Gemmatimonadaceae bacterium]|nr:LysR family transcriptional regulator [Gemmatimonadaceae bacterium]
MSLTKVELRHLRSFIVLGDELHFSRAAAALRVAQPALSQQIRRLETALGFRLFDRTSRKVELTPAGVSFLDHVRRLFLELDRAAQTGQHIASGKTGTLTVGYVQTAMVTVLPTIVRRFRERQPDVRVLLRELSSIPQIEGLRRGEIDVAIVSGTPGDEDIASFEVWRDPLVALVPPAHPASRRRSVSVSALATDPFIMFPRSQTPHVYDQIVSLCRKSGFEPTIAQEAQSWHLIAELVGAGMGVSVAPSSVRRYRVARVRYVPLRPTDSLSTMICYRRAEASIVAKLFVETARELV